RDHRRVGLPPPLAAGYYPRHFFRVPSDGTVRLPSGGGGARMVKISPKEPIGPGTVGPSPKHKARRGWAQGPGRETERRGRMQREIIIDMSEVTLVDRPSRQFLASQMAEDIKLVNCPEYIEPWFKKEAPPREGTTA